MSDNTDFSCDSLSSIQEQFDELKEYILKRTDCYKQFYNLSAAPCVSEQSLEKLSQLPIPESGRDPKAVADELIDNVFLQSMIPYHPKYFAFVPSGISPYSVAGSILTDIYNPYGGGWNFSPGGCLIEEKLVAWMGSLASYPKDKCGGIFVSGSSMACLTAFIAARDRRLKNEDFIRGCAYISDQTHSSVFKALRILGFSHIVKIPTDNTFKMRTDLLRNHIQEDIDNGKIPFLVVGTIGTTNTGSIDPLEELGAIASEYNLWFHIDGAFGAAILISDKYKHLAKGIELSDSFSWDTHKWALQVYSCSALIVKNKTFLLQSFSENPEYLDDIKANEHLDFWDLGIEMSKPNRAIKLWFTLQAMGTKKLSAIVDAAFSKSQLVKKLLLDKENWEIISEPMCGTLTFRYAPEGLNEDTLNILNAQITDTLNKNSNAYIVTTTLHNKKVIRMSMLVSTTSKEDIEEIVELIDKCACELIKKYR